MSFFEERAAIRQYDGRESQYMAELHAREDVERARAEIRKGQMPLWQMTSE